MPRGHKGEKRTPGSGRKKGTPNILTTRTREQLWLYAEKKKVNPFEHAIDVLAGEVEGAELKDILDCAKDLRSYLLPKPKAIEIEIGPKTRRVLQVRLTKGND